MFYNQWNDRESTLKHESERVEGDRTGKTYRVNDVVVTVWSDNVVTAQRYRYASSDPKAAFPGMEVVDGALTIPIEDLAGLVLSRCSPKELAEGLLSDDEAREAMIDAMAHRYRLPSFDDVDRRRFVAQVQTEIHSATLDSAIEKMESMETSLRSRTSYLRWQKAESVFYRQLYVWIYDLLSDEEKRDLEARFLHPDKIQAGYRDQQDPAQLEFVGTQWRESRDFWRRALLNHFSAPVIPDYPENDPLGILAKQEPAP